MKVNISSQNQLTKDIDKSYNISWIKNSLYEMRFIKSLFFIKLTEFDGLEAAAINTDSLEYPVDEAPFYELCQIISSGESDINKLEIIRVQLKYEIMRRNQYDDIDLDTIIMTILTSMVNNVNIKS